MSSQLVVNVTYGSYKSFNPYWFPGYAGRLARFQQAKETLDDQVLGCELCLLLNTPHLKWMDGTHGPSHCSEKLLLWHLWLPNRQALQTKHTKYMWS